MLQDVDPQYLCETPRYREMARLESYFDGSQYDCNPKLKPWTDDSVPMRERRPDIVYPLPKAAVNQAVRFALGDGKFPKLRVEQSETEDEFAPELAVTLEESKALTKSIDDMASKSCLASATRTAMRRGLSARTACLTLSIRNGRFRFEHPSAKDCIPYFADGDPLSPVTGMTVVKQYDDIEADRQGRPQHKRKFFRRDYTDTHIIEFQPAEVFPGKRIDWIERERIAHDLGECPVIWVPNMAFAGCEGIDGVSLFDGLLDEFDALNRALSQRHHALEILGVPQPWESGVKKGEEPGAVGRTAAPAPTEKRAPSGYSSPSEVQDGARKAGARHIWTYRGENAKAGLIETTGKAFEVVSRHIDDIRSRLLEAMDVILLDPTAVAGKGDMSAKALALMYAPMLALVDELREWWWEHCIRPAIEMMLRIVERRGSRGIHVKGARALESALQRRSVAVEDGTRIFVPPAISPLWGAYFAQSAEEAKSETDTASAAKKAGLITQKTATSYVASTFGIADVDAELEELEEDVEKAAEMAPPATDQPNEDNEPGSNESPDGDDETEDDNRSAEGEQPGDED